jgi:DNA repair protein RadC
MQPDTIRLRELTLRYDIKRDTDGREIHVGPRLRTPNDSARLLMAVLQHQASEVFGIPCLSTRHDVIAYHEVARGTLDSVLIEPRLCWAEHKRGYVATVVMWCSGCIRCTLLAPVLPNAT